MNNFDPGKLRAHRRAEAETGFPLLRGCPNTAAIALVNFLDSLSPADQVAYGEQLSSLEEAQAANPPKTNNEFLDLVRARPLLARHMGPSLNLVPPEAKAIDIRVVPVKLLSAVLKDNGGLEGWAKIARISELPVARTPAPAHATSFDEVVPVAPRRLRKLIDDAMKSRFAAEAQRMDKEHTRYVAALDCGRLTIDFMFARAGAMQDQFDCHLSGELNDGRKLWNLDYESVWRISNRWNYVTEANAGRNIAHLVRLIDTCLELV